MFEGLFGKKDSSPIENPPIEKGGFDSEDIKINRLANQVERDAMITNAISKFILEKIEELTEKYPDNYDKAMTLEKFVEQLEAETEFNNKNLIYQINKIKELSPEAFNDKLELNFFISSLNRKVTESDEILHPSDN
ncbi:MAG: hypothetical protein AAB392_02255 [Patescibacteria group bacterium]